MNKFFISLFKLLANVIDFFVNIVFFHTLKNFKAFYTTKSLFWVVLGVGGHISMILYIEPWLIVHRKLKKIDN